MAAQSVGSVSASHSSSKVSSTGVSRWWPFDDLTSGMGASFLPPASTEPSSGDLPARVTALDQDTVDAPGDGDMGDEERAVPTASTAHAGLVSRSRSTSLAALRNRVVWSPDEPHPNRGSAQEDTDSGLSLAQDAPKKSVKWKDEYDVVDDEAPQNGLNDVIATVQGEALTKEDLERQRTGDVGHVDPKARIRLRRMALRRSRLAAAQRRAVTHTRAAGGAAQAGGTAETTFTQGSPEMMKAKCVHFAGFLKGSGVSGTEFVRMWKGTCDPTVMSGKATPQYMAMCNALGGAANGFALDKGWSPEKVCEAVLRVFRDSGVGASPIQG